MSLYEVLVLLVITLILLAGIMWAYGKKHGGRDE